MLQMARYKCDKWTLKHQLETASHFISIDRLEENHKLTIESVYCGLLYRRDRSVGHSKEEKDQITTLMTTFVLKYPYLLNYTLPIEIY